MRNYDDDSTKREEEMKRFYRQQKSTRPECDWGRRNCATCEMKNSCNIYQYLK